MDSLVEFTYKYLDRIVVIVPLLSLVILLVWADMMQKEAPEWPEPNVSPEEYAEAIRDALQSQPYVYIDPEESDDE
jgi:hypothetical protein